MLFNSFEFLIFLPTVFGLYWFLLKNQPKLQNILILLSSYLFYGWWDYRFLSLLIFSTLLDYSVAIQLGKSQKENTRKLLLGISLLGNLGLLGFFKYYNFFIENLTSALELAGIQANPLSLNVILPVGISFYTFQTLSYTIDVYRKKLNPAQDFIQFSAYVTFFPQLVAGPIERATHLLPQFKHPRRFNSILATDGIQQILWGLFKKMVIADNAAVMANEIFNHSTSYDTASLILGSLAFTIQIYGDFSGYSDIALGTSKLFGFTLMKNFATPYFSRDIAEFWRRWHISLSTWFRDYLYIPLGGSKNGKAIRNTLIIFLVSGLWHGANWTFVLWGLYNALLFLPLLLLKSNRKHVQTIAANKSFPSPKEIFQVVRTFLLVSFGWILFRSNSVSDFFNFVMGMATNRGANNYLHNLDNSGRLNIAHFFAMVILLFSFDWLSRQKQHGLSWLNKKNPYFQYFVLLVVSILIVYLGGEQSDFIYFAF
jgi:alginate O-acetyltransferase complex protein AlgI